MHVEIWGADPLAEATIVAARSLGWTAKRASPNITAEHDLIVVAPLAETVDACDALLALPTVGRRAFAWPMVSVVAVQAMITRVRDLGELTNLSSRSTRPRNDLLVTVHDQVALLLLLSQIADAGPVTAASLHSGTAFDRLNISFVALTATVEVNWSDTASPSLDVQAAGADGVLRIETDPTTRLEHNGQPVPLPHPAPIDPSLAPLRDAGVIDMVKTVAACFEDDRPLAHAFSLGFGRSVVQIVESAQAARRQR